MQNCNHHSGFKQLTYTIAIMGSLTDAGYKNREMSNLATEMLGSLTHLVGFLNAFKEGEENFQNPNPFQKPLEDSTLSYYNTELGKYCDQWETRLAAWDKDHVNFSQLAGNNNEFLVTLNSIAAKFILLPENFHNLSEAYRLAKVREYHTNLHGHITKLNIKIRRVQNDLFERFAQMEPLCIELEELLPRESSLLTTISTIKNLFKPTLDVARNLYFKEEYLCADFSDFNQFLCKICPTLPHTKEGHLEHNVKRHIDDQSNDADTEMNHNESSESWDSDNENSIKVCSTVEDFDPEDYDSDY
jgi:hypothetical protein